MQKAAPWLQAAMGGGQGRPPGDEEAWEVDPAQLQQLLAQQQHQQAGVPFCCAAAFESDKQQPG